jgi:hypothetical protein
VNGRNFLIELIETELDANAKMMASDLHLQLTSGVTSRIDMEADLESLLGPLSEVSQEQLHELVLPAFKYRLFENLAAMLRVTAEGWSDVFYGNLSNDYDEGRLE